MEVSNETRRGQLGESESTEVLCDMQFEKRENKENRNVLLGEILLNIYCTNRERDDDENEDQDQVIVYKNLCFCFFVFF